jgi:hypothetical protein
LYIDFKYTEADGHVDNDYFNGTGEFIESHPAKINFSLIQIFKGEDDLEWHISTLKYQTAIVDHEGLIYVLEAIS